MIQRTKARTTVGGLGVLESYLCGGWEAGGPPPSAPSGGSGAPSGAIGASPAVAPSGPAILVNPATEEPLAEVSAASVDLAGALRFARERGGPELCAFSFRQRGAFLRTLSRALHAHRDELLALEIENGGNTRQDAKFDVDGAIGTLAAYADVGEQLGDARSLPDGDAIQLGRSARFFGRHLWVARAGVAVHVNAFNFPAWGLVEKAACALLAGMPVLSKPATSSALVAARVARVIVDAGVLPEGAFSFYCGPAAGLADHLGPEDVLAFTGSSETAAAIRGSRAFLFDSARANVEADSLNAAVLGPDVSLTSELADLFVADVVRDITQKAGQKCTAIRRIYVPEDALDGITDRLVDRLRGVRTGDPARDDVHMGPVATAGQLAEVRRGVATLATCGRVVIGGDRPGELAGVETGRGYFFAPTLVVAGEPSPTDPVHTREVFGPVA
ncbi:MAG: 3,4-dehydroadipyl-CoA semialdehyde dehydrogenase, partial [Myxococcales bacterium]|nr:3,4-dehydroadipyl-CoA semialdehyde dehydrogenase [Myxococcales bacterium]